MTRLLRGLIGLALCSWPATLLAATAAVGQPAPDFVLQDTHGYSHTLAEFRGKIVVLEWSNHECPFVRKHYDSGNMQRLQATYTQRGVVWLTIVSSAVGKQGHVTAEQANTIMAQRKTQQTAMLLDAEGTVGRFYGAKTTPHMFVVDQAGALVYAGAIDDTPSTNPDDVVGAANYVQRALEELFDGTPVSVDETKPYGCSVKY